MGLGWWWHLGVGVLLLVVWVWVMGGGCGLMGVSVLWLWNVLVVVWIDGDLGILCILQAGQFVYDILWVFFTPMMVSVAKSFDAPIKLLFPTSNSTRPFLVLGLGDIVIPGKMILH
ncbi:hypothetical protein RJT34_16325 [Clitoria ternatea]|uniref:Uncharacterized protein n=1 Tax=Clitoria ternatea TaxID=43366 RepID=A0AAN9J852_CLITE